MANIIIGFGIFLLSVITFAAILFTGAPAIAGNIALAVLLACMYGMWLGTYIITRA